MLALIANYKRILYGTALALLGTLLLVQTARIEGFLFVKGYAEKLADAKTALDDVAKASEEAAALARKAKAKIEEANERKADDARELEKKLRSDYDAALRKWLRSQAGRPTGNADLSGQSEAAERTTGAGGAAVLPEGHALVPIRDLELSAQAFAKLEALQSWVKSVTE